MTLEAHFITLLDRWAKRHEFNYSVSYNLDNDDYDILILIDTQIIFEKAHLTSFSQFKKLIELKTGEKYE